MVPYLEIHKIVRRRSSNMAKIEGVCREIMDKADWISISTEGADGPHVAATWGDYVRKLGFVNDETILVPLFGFRATERNLLSDDRIELLCATKLVPSTFSLGRGCRIRGKGHVETSGERFDAVKKAFSWARGVLVVMVEETHVQL
jgi:hypothetical protein